MATTITSRTKLYTIADVCAALKVSRVELWRRVKAGTFPRPLMDGHRPKWREPTIAKHLDKLEAAANG
jgi:predicted DNA-binding transcriptional regulator AlpA